MKQVKHPPLSDSPADRLYDHLAAAGYAPVLRDHESKLFDMPGLLTCREYWRLDNPRHRAIVSRDLSNDNSLVVTFRQMPKTSLARRLLDLFRTRAADIPGITLPAEELDRGMKKIPCADQVPAQHKRLAQSLNHGIEPLFFIDPASSHENMLTLRAHVEADLKKIATAEDIFTTSRDDEECLNSMARIAAQKLLKVSTVTLQVPPAGGDVLCLTARRMLMRSYQSQPQHMRFDEFIDNHEALLGHHVGVCQSNDAVRVLAPVR